MLRGVEFTQELTPHNEQRLILRGVKRFEKLSINNARFAVPLALDAASWNRLLSDFFYAELDTKRFLLVGCGKRMKAERLVLLTLALAFLACASVCARLKVKARIGENWARAAADVSRPP
jgi:hypothetical protein